MPRAGFANQPLRGYAPYSELDISLDRFRRDLFLEVPMWEGSDRPFAYVRRYRGPSASAAVIRPDLTHPPQPPGWNHSPRGGHRAARSLSGHGGIYAYSTTDTFTLTAQGYRWSNAIDPVSELPAYSFLAVGTPLTYMSPSPDSGDSERLIWRFALASGGLQQALTINFAFNSLRWHTNPVSQSQVIPDPLYGQRISILGIQGPEGGVNVPPRVYVAWQDGRVARVDFVGGGLYAPLTGAPHLEILAGSDATKSTGCLGGVWEYLAVFDKAFTDAEARWLLRNPTGLVGWDLYPIPRMSWTQRLRHIMAEASVYARVSGRTAAWPRVTATGETRPRVTGLARSTGPRLDAETDTYPRVTARVRINNEEANVQATPMCPSELKWLADNVLELADVMDDLPTTPEPIVTADAVTVEVWDRDADTLLTVSPVSLSQVGVTNVWRGVLLVNAANGFSEEQRLLLIFIFDGGVDMQGRFPVHAVVPKMSP